MNTFLYDGSLEGMISAFKKALEMNLTDAIFAKKEDNIEADDIFSSISVNIQSHQKDLDTFISELNSLSLDFILKTIFRTWLSDIKGIENPLYRVVAESLRRRSNILTWLTNPDVSAVNNACAKLSREIHRFKGILRFSQLENGIYLAKFAPDCNVIIPVAKHFTSRLSSEKWCILDEKRSITAVYIERKLRLASSQEISNILSANPASDEENIQSLWREFFSAIAIPNKINPKLQKRCLPQRYWKYLIETPSKSSIK